MVAFSGMAGHERRLCDRRRVGMDRPASRTTGGHALHDPLGRDRWGARFSPDGHWIAYSSARGGSRQVFVEPSDGEGSVVQVSDEDGSDTPVWSPDGHKLYYMLNGERIVMATLDPGPPLRVLGRTTLIDGGYFLNTGHASFDVVAGGKELLLLKTVTSDAELVVAYNWREQVRARLRASVSSQKR